MNTSEKTSDIMAAIAHVQMKLPLVAKDGEVKMDGRDARVEHFASHEAIWQKLQPLLFERNLCVTQSGKQGPNGSQWLTTRVSMYGLDDGSCEWIEGEMLVASPRPGFRDFGAFWSYARRISLLAIFGIVASGEDPDQREVTQEMKEAKPPRADRGARPAGSNKDPEALAAQAIKDLDALPAGSTAAQVTSISQSLSGVKLDSKTHDLVSSAFASTRKRLGLVQ